MTKTIDDAIFVAVICLLTLCGALECFAQEQDRHSFEETVKPFLVKHCYGCHSGDDAEAQFDLEKLTPDFSTDKTANRWIDVMHSLKFGEMPPSDEAQPTPIEKADVVGWVFRKMAETDRFDAWQKKLLAPEYGNWANHEKLFSGEIDTPPFSPSRLWRFSPEIFAHKGFGNAKSPYTYVTSERGIRDYAAMSVTDQSTVLMTIIVADSFLADRERRGDFKEFADDQPTPNEQTLQNVIGREFLRVIGRSPTKEQHEKYLTFLKESIETGGNLDGLKTTIKAMFLSPESIYRMEFGLGDVDEHGRRHLSQDEIAHAIAFALTDRGPDHNRIIRDVLRTGEIYKRRDGEFDRKLKEGKLTTREVDASGKIAFSGDPKVDGEVENAVEMMHRLGDSDRARQSFIRHLFRYFMGRNELLSDSKSLIEAEQAYLKNGGSFKSLVVSLLSSDSFLYRR